MDIGVVAPEFPPDLGGVETYAWEVSKRLAQRRHNVTVYTLGRGEAPENVAGLEVSSSLTAVRAADRAVFRRRKHDAWLVLNAAYAWVAAEFFNVVIVVHGNDFLRPYFRTASLPWEGLPIAWRFAPILRRVARPLEQKATERLMGKCLPLARRILANSQYTEAALLEQVGECRGKTHVAYVGVSDEFFQFTPERETRERERLITVARLSEARKNVDKVLHALAAISPKYDVEYRVVGDGRLRPELERLAERLGLRSQVRFLGSVSRLRMMEELSRAGLFVLPSSVLRHSHEGFGITYLEANACGTPVLATRHAGAAEAVRDEVSGFFVDEPSVEGIRRAIEGFLDGRVVFDPESCRAYAYGFTWDKVVDRVLESFDIGAVGVS